MPRAAQGDFIIAFALHPSFLLCEISVLLCRRYAGSAQIGYHIVSVVTHQETAWAWPERVQGAERPPSAPAVIPGAVLSLTSVAPSPGTAAHSTDRGSTVIRFSGRPTLGGPGFRPAVPYARVHLPCHSGFQARARRWSALRVCALSVPRERARFPPAASGCVRQG